MQTSTTPFMQLLLAALNLGYTPRNTQPIRPSRGFIFLGDGTPWIQSLAGLAYDFQASGNKGFMTLGYPAVLGMAMNLARAAKEEIGNGHVFVDNFGGTYAFHEVNKPHWLVHQEKGHLLNTWSFTLAQMLLDQPEVKLTQTTADTPVADEGEFVARIIDPRVMQVDCLLHQIAESEKNMQDTALKDWAEVAHRLPLSTLRTILGELIFSECTFPDNAQPETLTFKDGVARVKLAPLKLHVPAKHRKALLNAT